MAASRELRSGCRLEKRPVIAVPKRLQGGSATELDALLPAILDKAFKGEL